MNFAVVVFPGSNCDADCFHVIKDVLGENVEYVWHGDKSFTKKYDCVILPGGFSYGDYLRTGAIAKFSPIMDEVINFANNGGLVLGICNGFQILTETGLLPGALVRNKDLKFICKDSYLKVENNQSNFTNLYEENEVVKVPVAHGEGNYICSDETLKELKENKQIIFRYSLEDGDVSEKANFNGSIENIAGIINKEGNILGMMPHPERCAEDILGNDAGKKLFVSIVKAFKGGALGGK